MNEQMKQYIGTKHIEAEPMTMGEAYEKKLLQAGRVPNESEKDNAGYHVKYEDGYESWSPAEPFEKTYQVADTPLDRMTIEENELTDRMKKLTSFISGNKFKELDSATRSMLTSQYESMREYLAALCMRSTKMESGEGSYTNFSFDDAIDWFKEAIWHDASEIPEEGEQILYTDTEGGEIVDVNVTTTALYDFMPWNEVVRYFNISKWCYIEDLLPKGGEE